MYVIYKAEKTGKEDSFYYRGFLISPPSDSAPDPFSNDYKRFEMEYAFKSDELDNLISFDNNDEAYHHLTASNVIEPEYTVKSFEFCGVFPKFKEKIDKYCKKHFPVKSPVTYIKCNPHEWNDRYRETAYKDLRHPVKLFDRWLSPVVANFANYPLSELYINEDHALIASQITDNQKLLMSLNRDYELNFSKIDANLLGIVRRISVCTACNTNSTNNEVLKKISKGFFNSATADRNQADDMANQFFKEFSPENFEKKLAEGMRFEKAYWKNFSEEKYPDPFLYFLERHPLNSMTPDKTAVMQMGNFIKTLGALNAYASRICRSDDYTLTLRGYDLFKLLLNTSGPEIFWDIGHLKNQAFSAAKITIDGHTVKLPYARNVQKNEIELSKEVEETLCRSSR